MLKLFAFSFGFNIIFCSWCLAAAPSQAVVDEWIGKAMGANVEALDSGGPFICENAVYSDQPFRAAGNTSQRAQTNALFKCIRNQCNMLGSQIQSATDKIRGLSTQEFTDFMYSAGFGQDEIDQAIEARQHEPNSNIKNINCTNASPLARTFVADSCLSFPLNCHRN